MPCHGGSGQGHIDFEHSLAESCNVFYYKYGIDTGIDSIAAEARRFHLDRPTGIELPFVVSWGHCKHFDWAGILGGYSTSNGSNDCVAGAWASFDQTYANSRSEASRASF